MAKLVSKTYGEALYEIAMESGVDRAGELLEEIRGISELLKANPQFDELMKHPGRVSDELTGLFEVVVSKERYGDLPAIFAHFTERVKEQQRVGVAYVTTAVPLSAAQRSAVEAKLLETGGYRKMELNYQVDTSIIGGMIIRIGDRVVDSSVRTKLNGLTKQLLQIQLG